MLGRTVTLPSHNSSEIVEKKEHSLSSPLESVKIHRSGFVDSAKCPRKTCEGVVCWWSLIDERVAALG